MPNRLANALSPYLRQHADNPVDWREWEPEAFAEAVARGVPVLLSVGYAACHWCHVMAHESFEDAAVAEAINTHFVAIKVDREERPDIDAVYMQATQAMTGRGGWPMTCFLTPSGEPFFAGTYFPRAQFLQLLDNVRRAWAADRLEVVATGENIAAELRRRADPSTRPDAEAGHPAVTPADLSGAVRRLAADYDAVRGGFGDAPKFPPGMVLTWLLRHHARTGDAQALELVQGTATAMARGGLYDQLAGGFARYSVDADWVVPHFEKMLYDNALLLGAYTQWWRLTGSPLARRVALETADFIVRDLGTPEGAFAASLDADATGPDGPHEGLTYVWTPRELDEALGPEDGRRAAALLSVTATGTFEHGSSTLQLRADPEDHAWWERVRRSLLARRAARPQPARDDKVVASWNGLAIDALATAGDVFGEPRFVAAAAAAARFLSTHHLTGASNGRAGEGRAGEGRAGADGWDAVRLARVSLGGRLSGAAGLADDYGNLALGLATLSQVTGDTAWLAIAGRLTDAAQARFAAGDGGFFDTADDAEALYQRPRQTADSAEPSGQSALAMALTAVGALTGSPARLVAASEAVASSARLALRLPQVAGWALAAAEALAAGPLEVAVVHEDSERGRAAAAEYVAVLRGCPSPGLVRAVGPVETVEAERTLHPLLAFRPLVGAATAYLCRGFVCEEPASDPAALAAQLSRS